MTPSSTVPTTSDLPSQLIKGGAAQIRAHGWAQGSYTAYSTGAHCIVGSLLAEAAAQHLDHWSINADVEVAIERLEKQLSMDHLGGQVRDVINWNDTDATEAEVLAVMDRAAELKYMEGRDA